MYVCIYVCSHRMSMHCMHVYIYVYVYICARVLDTVAHELIRRRSSRDRSERREALTLSLRIHALCERSVRAQMLTCY